MLDEIVNNNLKLTSNHGKAQLWQATAVGLGNIVGAGIFVMAGSAIDEAGPSTIIAFLVTATLAMTVGLNSAELASKMPNVEGGVYSFARSMLDVLHTLRRHHCCTDP